MSVGDVLEDSIREAVLDEITYKVQGQINTLNEDAAKHEERLEALEGRVDAVFVHLEAVHAQLRALRAAESDDAPRYVQGDRTEDPDPYAPSEELDRVRARNARAESALATSSYNIVSIDAAHEAVVDLCVDLVMYLPEYRRELALDSVRMHVNAGDSETL